MTPSTRAWGGHSMVAPLRRALVYPPVPPAPEVSWQAFGYLRPIDHELAAGEHAALCRLLAGAGVEVVRGEIADPALQDAIFPFDPVLITGAGAILGRMGKALREREVALAETTLRALDIPIAGRIEAPGKLEGGDCLWLDARTLAVGRGYRTNAEGIRQLGALSMRCTTAPLPLAPTPKGSASWARCWRRRGSRWCRSTCPTGAGRRSACTCSR